MRKMNCDDWREEARWCHYSERRDLDDRVGYDPSTNSLVPLPPLPTPSPLESLAGGISAPIPGPFADRWEYCVDKLDQ